MSGARGAQTQPPRQERKQEAKKPSISGSAHLIEAPINLLALREHSRKELAKLLDKVPGSKALVLDKKIAGSLGLVSDVSLLRAHDVEDIFYLESHALQTACTQIVYLVRPLVHTMKLIAEQIHMHAQRDLHKKYTLYFVPRMTYLCERVLAEHGVLGDVTTAEYHMDLIAIDDNLMTLACDNVFNSVFLNGEITPLYYVARSIMKLQSVFGIIPNIKAKGTRAASVLKLIKRMRKEESDIYDSDNSVPEIDTLIVLDRTVDMISPCLTPSTYEGLLDEHFGVENCMIEVPKSVLGQQAERDGQKKDTSQAKAFQKIPLNNSDSMFKDIRDYHFDAIGSVLHDRAAVIQEAYKEKDTAQSISQISKFMKKFKHLHQDHQLLTIHINLAEMLGKVVRSQKFRRKIEAEHTMLSSRNTEESENYLEECIAREVDLPKVLRLLCLLSISNNGIRSKKYDFFKREILHTYGYEALFTLFNLEKLGLLTKKETSFVAVGNWSTIRKSFRLYKDAEHLQLNNQKAPSMAGSDDLNYTYGAYAPLSVRLVEAAHGPGWQALEEPMELIPGPTVEDRQHLSSDIQERYTAMKSAANPERRNPITLVYFIGGVTFPEISAFRMLSRRDGHSRDYMIATTKLISGNELFSEIITDVPNNLDKATMAAAGK